jgi:cytochrome P450
MMKGEHHRQQRRLMMPAFHKEQIAGYHHTMVTLTQQRLAGWQPGSSLDMYAEMRDLTQQIVVQTLFGLEEGTNPAHLGTLLERLVASMAFALMMPINLPGTPYYRAMRTAAQLESELQALIAHKRASPGGRDLLTMLIQARDEDGTMLSDVELVSHAFTLFSAGHETTTAALTWTIFLLCQHPHIYTALLDELNDALHGAPPTPAQVRELPLLDGVVKEGLRLLSPATVGMRRTTADCELGGFALPRGATIIFSQFVTHRLPQLYAEPDRFLPERWFSIKRGPYEYLPFSAGSHRCIGAEFAMHEIKTVLATLLPQRRLAVQPDAVLDVNFTLQPKQGVPMHVLDPAQSLVSVPVRGNIQRLVDLPA